MTKFKSKPTLVVVSGFSGTGKGTLMNRLLEKHPDEYCLSISATTRKPRSTETDGVNYFFKSVEEFEDLIENGGLIEYTKYLDNYYGTPKSYVEENLEKGKTVLLEIEMDGASQVKKMYPESLLIFIAPPSIKTLEERLTSRGTETKDIINSRLRRACDESVYMTDYDYIIINDDLELCVDQIHNLISIERSKVKNNMELINTLKEELKIYR